jgi:hypothetical protein
LREAARAGLSASIDWENVAEEIEILGRADRRALGHHIAIVIEHLLKLQAAPAPMPGQGWPESILRARHAIEDLLEDSPSLRGQVAGMITNEFPHARAMVRASCQDYGEQPPIDIDQIRYTEDQVLGDWMPERA